MQLRVLTSSPSYYISKIHSCFYMFHSLSYNHMMLYYANILPYPFHACVRSFLQAVFVACTLSSTLYAKVNKTALVHNFGSQLGDQCVMPPNFSSSVLMEIVLSVHQTICSWAVAQSSVVLKTEFQVLAPGWARSWEQSVLVPLIVHTFRGHQCRMLFPARSRAVFPFMKGLRAIAQFRWRSWTLGKLVIPQ